MHIAFLTPEYPHSKIKSSAGIGTSIKNLARQLIVQNHKVSVFVYSQDSTDKFTDADVTIYNIAHKKYGAFGWFLYRKHIQNFINNIVIRERIDVVEAADWTGITAFMKLKCSLVIRLHGTDSYFCNLEGRSQKVKNFFFEKMALKGASTIVSVSAFTALKTKELFKLERKIQIIHNGINTTFFKPLSVSIKTNSLLYFGSIIRKKGVLELAYIFNQVVESNSDTFLTLLGKDVIDYKTAKSTLELFLNILSHKAKQRVRHIDNVPYVEVKEHIAKASVIVLPSFAEAFPMTWLEAMAMEKAIVASNIGWAKEVLRDGKEGYLVFPKNHQEYADRIINILNDESYQIEFGNLARKKVENEFNIEIIAKKNVDFYNRVIS